MKKKQVYKTILQVFLSFWASFALFKSMSTYSMQWFLMFIFLIAPALVIQKNKIKEHNQNEIFNFIKYIYFFLGDNAQQILMDRNKNKHLLDILNLYYLYDYVSNEGKFQVHWNKADKQDLIIYDKEIIFYVKYFHRQYRKLILEEYEKEKKSFLYDVYHNPKFKKLTNFFILIEPEISNSNLLKRIEDMVAVSSEEEINQPADYIKLFIERNLINKKKTV